MCAYVCAYIYERFREKYFFQSSFKHLDGVYTETAFENKFFCLPVRIRLKAWLTLNMILVEIYIFWAHFRERFISEYQAVFEKIKKEWSVTKETLEKSAFFML